MRNGPAGMAGPFDVVKIAQSVAGFQEKRFAS